MKQRHTSHKIEL